MQLSKLSRKLQAAEGRCLSLRARECRVQKAGFHYDCFYNLGVFVVGVLIIRNLVPQIVVLLFAWVLQKIAQSAALALFMLIRRDEASPSPGLPQSKYVMTNVPLGI